VSVLKLRASVKKQVGICQAFGSLRQQGGCHDHR
jgi:hypothetical protein